MSEQSTAFAAQAAIHPSPLDLGVTYQGALLEGSFQVQHAREVREVKLTSAGQGVIELAQWANTGRGLVWRFRVQTEKPMSCLAFVKLETDTGSPCTHFSFEVRPGSPPGGRLLFCGSPFQAYSDRETHAGLKLAIRELQIQLNATHELPQDLSPFQVVVLHREGLQSLVQGDRHLLHRYLAAGGRVVVFADYFYRQTVMLANHLTEPYGVLLEDREYEEVLCDRRHIADHAIAEGVGRLRWFRPSPVIASGEAKLLVRNPERPEEGFVACSGPHQNLLVIGTSLISSLVCVGWPFDNGRLFANLLGYSGK